MNAKFSLVFINSSLGMAASGLLPQSTTANSFPLNQTLKCLVALENEWALGQRGLLPTRKMKLTGEPMIKLKPSVDDFAKPSQETTLNAKPLPLGR